MPYLEVRRLLDGKHLLEGGAYVDWAARRAALIRAVGWGGGGGVFIWGPVLITGNMVVTFFIAI